MPPILTDDEVADLSAIDPPHTYVESEEVWLAKKQHKRTLSWIRERLEAGAHLDDLLAEERA